jgi:hypothetical protein
MSNRNGPRASAAESGGQAALTEPATVKRPNGSTPRPAPSVFAHADRLIEYEQ